MSGLTPDVAGEGEVVCPCGEYRVSTELIAEVEWPSNQVVCPACGLVLEPIEP